jgi:hypothetical protein
MARNYGKKEARKREGRRLNASQVLFILLGIVIALAMVLSLIAPLFMG